MGDTRNPRRGLPLPAPPPDEDRRGRRGGTSQGYRVPAADITGELPRLPEVELHEEASEVRVDHRALSPGRGSLSRAHAGNPFGPSAQTKTNNPFGPNAQTKTNNPFGPNAATRAGRPTAPDKPLRPQAQATRQAVQAPPQPQPKPPSRSAGPRVQTAEFSSLIGGRYQIVSRIGQGGMGKVYKVTHAHLSRTFALKIISNHVAETDEARELFYREARFASAMAHQNITAVVDFGEDEKVGMFMVMEFVDGEPLNRVLFKEKKLSVKKACEIVLQVAEALHYIHKQNVVHCDIKTENILICEEDYEGKRPRMYVKLLDFGLARSLVASRASTSLSGTPHYVAPERIRGEPASPASDVYGVGILLYELLTGQVPWDGPVQKILAGHLDEKPRLPSSLIEGGLDAAVERLVLHALEKRPAQRHKDMAAFIYELRTVMDMLGMSRRGRGGGGAGVQKRVVIEQRPSNASQRDELARVAFDGCRLPLALLTGDGVIAAANPAFAKFVMGVSVEVEGLPIRSTPLATAWSSCDQDLERTLAGNPIRRIIEIDVAPGEVRRLLLWLDALSQDQVVLGVQPLEL